jgi:hypothetical protein
MDLGNVRATKPHALSSVKNDGTDGITLLTHNPVGKPEPLPLSRLDPQRLRLVAVGSLSSGHAHAEVHAIVLIAEKEVRNRRDDYFV